MQWHQLDHMLIICMLLPTDNHNNTSSLDFYWPDTLPDAQQTVSKHFRQDCKIYAPSAANSKQLMSAVRLCASAQCTNLPVFHNLNDIACILLSRLFTQFNTSSRLHAIIATHKHATNDTRHLWPKYTYTCLTALYPGLPRCAGTRKVKPIWILLQQETVSGSGISWAICKSAARSRQITTPAPHHSVFTGWPTNSVKAPKHWRL